MKHATHIIGGSAAWAGVSLLTQPPAIAVAGGLLVAGLIAPWPDIDNLGTWARRKRRRRKAAWYAIRVMPNRRSHPVKYRLALLVSQWGTHRRGPCHSLLGGFLVAAAAVVPLAWWPEWPLWVPAAVLAGWWSHLLLDLANEDPVMLLWPWRRLFHGLPAWLRCRVGGLGEVCWRAGLAASVAAVILHYRA